ncbi:STAS domain-containing protein [Fuerstiella marisgermanici]|uniref:Anti-sigma factor antagonist n=1 Tax=Fuerstiella marisgermanici TaxID=1891926 RepID=A0A1P8WNB3_9PLAN|nr:STAS domain-containing protein [Fuerstiella marisgermanici]APZ95521.1 Anti-anti-sigma-B factor [Fuerstiella marisgermanici]
MIDYKTHRPDAYPEVLVVELSGKLDAETSDYLIQCIQTEIESGARKVVLDCSKLDYISSLGLGTLVRASHRVKKQDGAIALAGVQGMVAEVLAIAQLGRLLHMYPDVDAAATSFAA